MPVIHIDGRKVSCQAILFDKDGTLFDFIEFWGEWAATLIQLLESQLKEIGATIMGPKSRLIGLHYDEHGRIAGYDKTSPFAMGTEEEVTGLLAWQLYVAGVPWDEAIVQIRRISALAMTKLEQSRNVRPIPGLIQLLAACRRAGISLGVVTSDRTAEALKHLEWLGINCYFSSVVGRDRVSQGKPDPEMAMLALKELDVAPEQCIVIGDSNADMVMGKQAGVGLRIGIAPEGGGETYLLDADLMITDYENMTVLYG